MVLICPRQIIRNVSSGYESEIPQGKTMTEFEGEFRESVQYVSVLEKCVKGIRAIRGNDTCEISISVIW